MKPAIISFVGLATQFLAWMIALIVLLSGKNGHLEDVYFLSLNTSKLGIDALADTNLFNFNESNVLLSSLGSKPTVVPNNGALTVPSEPKLSKVGNRFRLRPRQSAPPPPSPDTAIAIVTTVIDYVIGKLKVDTKGTVATLLKRVASTSVADVEKGVKQCSGVIKASVVTDVSLILADALTQLAASFKASAGAASPAAPPAASPAVAAKPPKKRDAIGASIQRLEDFHMTAEDADLVSHSLANEITGNSLVSSTLLEGVSRMITNFNQTSSPNIGVKAMQGKSDVPTTAVTPTNDGLKALTGVLLITGPTISQGMKQQVLKSMNDQVKSVKAKVPVYDFYAFYPAGMSWGRYDTANDGKMKKNTYGFGTTGGWQGINISPLVKRIMGGSAKLPEKIGLGSGMDSTLAGLQSFTKTIYIINIIAIVQLTFGMVGSLIAVIGSYIGLLDGKWLRTLYQLNLSVCGGAMSMVYSNAIVMSLTLGGMGYMLPGTLAGANVTIHFGSKYIALIWLDTALSLIATACWFMLWKGMVMKDEFRRGIKRGKEKAAEKAAADREMVEHKLPMTAGSDQIYQYRI